MRNGRLEIFLREQVACAGDDFNCLFIHKVIIVKKGWSAFYAFSHIYSGVEMKVCLFCGQRYEVEDLCSPSCHRQPDVINGFLSFSPELSDSNECFNPEAFKRLFKVETTNFWFRSRNELLFWALEKYFPHAESFFEIGCGTGYVLFGIQREFPNLRLYGSDIFSNGLSYAEQRLSDVSLFQMDARNIPFENEFDVIGAFDVIEHIEEDEIALSSIFRAVKSGGVIITVPQHQWLWSKNDEVACHKRRYSKKELAEKVENAGFRVLRMTSFVSFLLPLMVASRLRWQLGVGEQKDSGSELRQPPLLNALLKGICGIERSLIRNGTSFPAGGSLLCVAVKG